MTKKGYDHMRWPDTYPSNQEPTAPQIAAFVNTPLWDDLNNYLKQTYGISPTLFYSRCSMEHGFWEGWNIKYKKKGKSLCTLYPKQGYFVALIPIGLKADATADLILPFCSPYTQALFAQTKAGKFGKSLPIEVTNENILDDVKNLVALRTK